MLHHTFVKRKIVIKVNRASQCCPPTTCPYWTTSLKQIIASFPIFTLKSLIALITLNSWLLWFPLT
jgi:hypothetical protein